MDRGSVLAHILGNWKSAWSLGRSLRHLSLKQKPRRILREPESLQSPPTAHSFEWQYVKVADRLRHPVKMF